MPLLLLVIMEWELKVVSGGTGKDEDRGITSAKMEKGIVVLVEEKKRASGVAKVGEGRLDDDNVIGEVKKEVEKRVGEAEEEK
ncbi:hypothetical protein ES319_A06G051600v1 [Gossypium barbadense]|uniref:Uncharacterized protein n=2 Tax=Gossypium TaxID=3633 RepID=A0A5J5VA57_GOSBA|nr:hypothetical protein ES319_A06G051600v1 [Gossypium barbadense]TYH12288.1 hypothetical protein ES288_A06G055500v1 [Gossypium darwinii]